MEDAAAAARDHDAALTRLRDALACAEHERANASPLRR